MSPVATATEQIPTVSSIEKAIACARLADDKKAENIHVLDIRKVCDFADVFVLCTGDSTVQLGAIARNINEGMKEQGIRALSTDGLRQSTWAVIDYGDVVVHIMTPDTRSYYRLEDLWGDAVAVQWEK